MRDWAHFRLGKELKYKDQRAGTLAWTREESVEKTEDMEEFD